MTKRSTIIMAITLVFLWASNWPASQVALDTMQPITFRLVTLLGGALTLFLLSIEKMESLAVPSNIWPRLIVFALLNIGIFNVISAYSISILEGGRAATIAFTMPVWVTVIEIILGCRITGGKVFSLVAGITGLLFIVYSVITDPSFEPVAAILMFIAALSWAIGAVWIIRSPLGLEVRVAAMWMMLISTVFVAFFLFLQTGEIISFPNTVVGWFGLVFATIIGMGVCQLLWFTLLESVGSIHGAFILLAIPPVGVFMSYYLTNSHVTIIDIIGLSFLLLAAITSALSNAAKSG